MTRATSIDTYNKIKKEGLLSRLRFDVYACLYLNGPMTQGECWRAMNGTPRPSVTPRFAELDERGVIECIGERECRVTGRMALLWSTTDRLPLKNEKPIRHKCKSCGGRGYHEEIQSKFF